MMSISQLTIDPNLANSYSGLEVSSESKTKLSSSKMDSVFQQFVGETFYQLMLKSLHKMHDKPAYLHGGQAEALFQGQLDQEIASRLAQTDMGALSRDLYAQFQSQIANRS